MRMKRIMILVLPLLMTSISGCSSKGEKFVRNSNENGSMSYEIFVRSFYDSNEDGIGDLNGVKVKIPYLYDLGIKTVWLTPIHKSPSYHGYDVSNYYTVNTQFGTLEDFDALVEEANKYHIDIMLDMVFNHCSNKNKYFTDSYEDYKNNNTSETSKANWFNWSETSKDGYNKYNDLYYESRFSSSMPDFNLDSEGVRKEIDNIMKFWIVDHKVKGFRLDAVLYYYYMNSNKNIEFLTWLEETAHKYDENFYMVGEAWDDAEVVNNYHNSKLDSFFRFDGAINGDFYSIPSLAKATSSPNKIASIEENETKVKENNPHGYSSYFLSNHDQDRVNASFTLEQSKCAASLLCLMPGTPFMYYGEEIMLKGKRGDKDNTDALRRLPMIWKEKDKVGECRFPEKNKEYLFDGDQVKEGAEDLLKDSNSLVNHYKKVINIRNKYPFMKNGVFKSLSNDITAKGTFGYQISLDNEYVNIYHNFSEKSATIKVSGTTIVDQINISKTGSSLKGDQLTLSPYSSVIIK